MSCRFTNGFQFDVRWLVCVCDLTLFPSPPRFPSPQRKGAMKEYLEELVSDDESRGLERWFYSEWIEKGLRKGYVKKNTEVRRWQW